jgi:aspartyl aminopeptidase
MSTLCRVPELAIHLNRGVNDTGFQVNPQNHLNACLSGSASKLFVTSLEEEVGAKIIDFEMQLFDAQPAALGGLSKEWIYSGRLDNLLSCEAILDGLVSQSEASEQVRGAFFFDNEEIGSETRTGAAGNFAEAMLERVAASGGISHGEMLGKLSDSILLSLDVAHATHPAYVEKMEPNHSPILGKGIVLKTNAKKRYASEAQSNAVVKMLCLQNQIPLQTFVSRNDMPCGSTVGPHLSAELGIPTVDLGEAILSMHSIREMSAVADHDGMRKLMHVFYQA